MFARRPRRRQKKGGAGREPGLPVIAGGCGIIEMVFGYGTEA
jgi:hypothetical protein